MGGFLEDQRAVSLAAVGLRERLLLLAQIGGAVKITTREKGSTRWGEWVDVARMPTEARSLLYVYVGALLLLAIVMVVSGLVALRRRLGAPLRVRDLDVETADALVADALAQRRMAVGAGDSRGPAAPRESARPSEEPADAARASSQEESAEEDASIPDRFMAFLIDFFFVFLLFVVLGEILQVDLSPRPNDDPVRTLAIVAWATLGFVGYLCLFEVLFGRTFGKRIVGLEVRTLQGGTPPLLARIYRNLFRIELLFLATPIPIASPWGDQKLPLLVPFVALIVMVATPRTQRPGDVVAGTVVQRSRTRPMSEEEEDS
ncbi:RDD family protein [bacterium]|nr:RDD family protein [bacterium]